MRLRGSLGRIHGDESLASVRVRGGRGWRSWGNESVGGREGGREGGGKWAGKEGGKCTPGGCEYRPPKRAKVRI